MITIIQGHERQRYADIIDQMFQLRARVFSDRLGWEVKVENGREFDQFDELDPLYLVSITDDNRVVGCARLLQTTGPTMLSHVFDRLVPSDGAIRSPIVWESTRFCVDTADPGLRAGRALARITGELMAAEIEVGLKAGLSHIVTVVDIRMERILKRGGCPVERIGDVVDYGGVPTLAVLIPVDLETLLSIQQANGLTGSCIDGDADVAPLLVAA
jgi:acyl homoserine lactone synthase